MTFVSMGPSLPTVEIAIDFDNDPTSTTRTWTDVTPYCRDFSIVRGRENELTTSTPGTLEVLLDNRDRRFDPSNTSGPYYPYVLPTRRIRVRATWLSVVYNLFHGYVDDWPLEWPDGGVNDIVTVTATDAFKALNLYDLAGKSYAAQLTSARLGTVFYDAGFGTADYSLRTGQSTVAASGTLSAGAAALGHAQDVVQSENGVLFVDGGGTILFQDRHYRILFKGTASGTIGDTAGEIRYENPVVPYGEQYLWTRALVTPSGGTAEEAVDAAGTASHYARTLPRSTLVASQSEALNAAQYLVNRYATPTLRVDAVDVVPARGTAQMATLLGLDISDRVVFRRRPAAGGTIEIESHIEQIGHKVTVGRDWRIPIRLSPAEAETFWLAGDAVYSLAGETTVAAY